MAGGPGSFASLRMTVRVLLFSAWLLVLSTLAPGAFALTPEQAKEIPQVQEMLQDPPSFLQEWSKQVGAKLEDGLREAPSWIAFALENGTVFHTYTVMAPDPFVAPYFSSLLERTPKVQAADPHSWRKDEYPD